MKKIAISFCFLILFGMFAFLPFGLNGVLAETSLEGDGTAANPYTISNVDDFNFFANKVNSGDEKFASASYKLEQDISFIDSNGINHFTTKVGDEMHPFKGTFDGGGNSLKNVKMFIADANSESWGIFGYTNGATIKNLSVQVVFVMNLGEEVSSRFNIGGLVGSSTASEITNCKTEIALHSERIEDGKTINITASSKSSINFGGIVGYSEGTLIHDSFTLVEFAYSQEAGNLSESFFGGAVGKMMNGEIYNVYVAPTEETVRSITGVVADIENMTLNNANNQSIVAFGGIVGYASGSQLRLFNTLFIGYLKANNYVSYGGIIGRIHPSLNLRPSSSNIATSKYLVINNAQTVTFSEAIANAREVNFALNSTLAPISSMPNGTDFFEGENAGWNDLVVWNFSDVWKTSTIFTASGIFLPDLQQFSELSVYLDYQNYSTFYSLNFAGKNVSETYARFKIGDEVTIEATFNQNASINYANFYEFDKWKKVGDETFASNGKVSLTFVCSNQTAGSYYITIVGKEVDVNVSIVNENGTAGNFGSVSYASELKNENFTFKAKYADDTSVIRLEAIDALEEYKFSHFESGENFSSQNKIINFKLDNLRANLPEVNAVDGKLVCNIKAVFSNNTSVLNIKTTNNGGTVKIDGGENKTGDIRQTVVNSKDYELTATPSEGYIFEGWFVNGEKVESENKYIANIKSNMNIEARFKKAEDDGNGINIWIIIGPIIGAVVLAGIITLIVVLVKKRGNNSYKKNFRY